MYELVQSNSHFCKNKENPKDQYDQVTGGWRKDLFQHAGGTRNVGFTRIREN